MGITYIKIYVLLLVDVFNTCTGLGIFGSVYHSLPTQHGRNANLSAYEVYNSKHEILLPSFYTKREKLLI